MKKAVLFYIVAAVACIWLVLALMSMGGCSGMQATKAMETTITDNAAVATVQLATEQTLDSAKAGMADNTVKFKIYYDAATVNVFAYWFDAEKQIWCTAKYYQLLRKNHVASGVFLQNVNVGSYTDDVVKGLFREECKWMQQVNDATKGSEVQR